MSIVLEIGAIFVAISVCLICVGYNLKMAGYSRKKMLEGQSFSYQMSQRKRLGRSLIDFGIYLSLGAIMLFFVMLGLVIPIETIEITPAKIDILTAQTKTIIIADKKTYIFDSLPKDIKKPGI